MTCPAFLEWVDTIPDDDLQRLPIAGQKRLNQGIVFAYTGMPGMPEKTLYDSLDVIHDWLCSLM